MGLAVSVQTDVTKQIINGYYNIVNSIVANATSDAKFTGSGSQTTVFSNCPPACNSPSFQQPIGDYCMIGGDVNITQLNSSETEIVGSSMSEVIANIKNDLNIQTEAYINNIQNTNPAWFSAAFNVLTNNNETVETISIKITNSVNSNTSTYCYSESDSTQVINVLNCGIVSGSFNVSQNIFQHNTVSCITKQIVKFTVENSVISEAIAAGNNTGDSGAQSYLTYIIIGIIAFIIILILIAIIRSFNRPRNPVIMPLYPPGIPKFNVQQQYQERTSYRGGPSNSIYRNKGLYNRISPALSRAERI
jgi:hypothetical protein